MRKKKSPLNIMKTSGTQTSLKNYFCAIASVVCENQDVEDSATKSVNRSGNTKQQDNQDVRTASSSNKCEFSRLEEPLLMDKKTPPCHTDVEVPPGHITTTQSPPPKRFCRGIEDPDLQGKENSCGRNAGDYRRANGVQTRLRSSVKRNSVESSKNHNVNLYCGKTLTIQQALKEISGQKSVGFSISHTFKMLKMRNRQLDNNEDSAISVSNRAWVDKYRPISLNDMVGNEESFLKLRNWLDKAKTSKSCQQRECDDSDDDFVIGDEVKDCLSKDHMQGMIIYGPNGCGKTSAVYAVANDLGFKVIEMNASTKRTKQILLSDLLEATQSHQVQDRSSSSTLFRFFESRGKFDKSQNKKSKENDSEVLPGSLPALILIDEADIVIEKEDEGFESAIKSLLICSKRPIIFCASKIECMQLMGVRDLCETVELSHPSRYAMSVWLQLMCLVEGMYVNRANIEHLLAFCHDDARHTINQLQLWLTQSFPCAEEKERKLDCSWVSRMFPVHMNEFTNDLSLGALWWNISLPSISNNHGHESSVDCKSKIDLKDIVTLTDTLCDLDVTSKIFRGENFDVEPCPRSWEKAPYGEMSPEEDLRWCNVGSVDVARSISDLLIGRNFVKYGHKRTEENCCRVVLQPPPEESIRRRNKHHSAEAALSEVVSLRMALDRWAVPLDYLAVLHIINHQEMLRYGCNTKRRQRFFHYLKKIGLSTQITTLDILQSIFN
ncbi:replication factor C subunit 1 isoform X2 [Anabrus simplex]|uniref:replication factor C subunit 1 isoform X2 n=1 Tax=Anabrus simplex TaxID=316456 RepID=UPI0035A37921